MTHDRGGKQKEVSWLIQEMEERSPLWGTLAHWRSSEKDALHKGKGSKKSDDENMGHSGTELSKGSSSSGDQEQIQRHRIVSR